jgi:hypothetical protein
MYDPRDTIKPGDTGITIPAEMIISVGGQPSDMLLAVNDWLRSSVTERSYPTRDEIQFVG